ncbi:MAG: helix-turn-helix domain-containing protein, partial [Pseudomonadota bacterium]
AFDATSNAVLILFATSGRLLKALRLIARYNHIYTRTLTVRLEAAETTPTFIVDSHLRDASVSYFAVSSFVLFIDSFFKDALAGQHLVTHVEMAMLKPPGFDKIHDQFGFNVYFDCERTRIHLDPALIDKPLRHADPQTRRLITEFCEKQLIDLNAEISMVGAVKALILEHISAPPTLEQAASIIGVSSRSLRRHLRSSGTTYKSILSGARQALAIKLLRETQEPISAIAYEVGFEHPSHFGRAFKNWTGQSPSGFRKIR